MSENKKKFEQEAKAFFADKKNDNVNKVYVTSDGNLFRAEHYADNWKTQLADRTVEVYERPSTKKLDVNESSTSPDAPKKDSPAEEKSTLRDEMVKEYIELFDTKPAHNISLEKLQDKITAKRLELSKEAQSNLDADAAQSNEESAETENV